jgi:hypothetical protein
VCALNFGHFTEAFDRASIVLTWSICYIDRPARGAGTASDVAIVQHNVMIEDPKQGAVLIVLICNRYRRYITSKKMALVLATTPSRKVKVILLATINLLSPEACS